MRRMAGWQRLGPMEETLPTTTAPQHAALGEYLGPARVEIVAYRPDVKAIFEQGYREEPISTQIGTQPLLKDRFCRATTAGRAGRPQEARSTRNL